MRRTIWTSLAVDADQRCTAVTCAFSFLASCPPKRDTIASSWRLSSSRRPSLSVRRLESSLARFSSVFMLVTCIKHRSGTHIRSCVHCSKVHHNLSQITKPREADNVSAADQCVGQEAHPSVSTCRDAWVCMSLEWGHLMTYFISLRFCPAAPHHYCCGDHYQLFQRYRGCPKSSRVPRCHFQPGLELGGTRVTEGFNSALIHISCGNLTTE